MNDLLKFKKSMKIIFRLVLVFLPLFSQGQILLKGNFYERISNNISNRFKLEIPSGLVNSNKLMYFEIIPETQDTFVILVMDTMINSNDEILTESKGHFSSVFGFKINKEINFIIDFDLQQSDHFAHLGDCKNGLYDYSIFFHLNLEGYLRYYFLDKDKGNLYSSESIEENIVIDYLSCDLEKMVFVGYKKNLTKHNLKLFKGI